MKFLDALNNLRLLKTFVHPITDKLSFLAETTSTKAKAMATTEMAAIIQQNIANNNDPSELSRTLCDLKNIPAPIEEPITTKIAEKNEIFFCVDAWAIPLFSFSLDIINPLILNLKL